MATSTDRPWSVARAPNRRQGRREQPDQAKGDDDQPRRARASWLLAGWSVAGSTALFGLLLWIEPALGTGGGGSVPKEWDLAFHVASDGEQRRPVWLRDAPAEAPGRTPGGGEKVEQKRAAESSRESLVVREGPGKSGRSAGVGISAARLSSLPGVSGSEPSSEGGAGGERNYRVRRTSVIEEAHRKGPVRLAPPPRRVAVDPRPLNRPKPQYPAAAKKGEKEGSVSVKVLISEIGKVSRWEILAADPPGVFEKSVQDAIQVWEFSPALDQFGKPIECWKPYNLSFKFEDSR